MCLNDVFKMITLWINFGHLEPGYKCVISEIPHHGPRTGESAFYHNAQLLPFYIAIWEELK